MKFEFEIGYTKYVARKPECRWVSSSVRLKNLTKQVKVEFTYKRPEIGTELTSVRSLSEIKQDVENQIVDHLVKSVAIQESDDWRLTAVWTQII